VLDGEFDSALRFFDIQRDRIGSLEGMRQD
jgi:hypothetical protein